MDINVYNQFYNFLLFILTGIAIGILFDIFRIVRRSFKTPDFITYIEDILFWILSGTLLLFSIFIFNSGELRSYIFIGLIIGITIYIFTISKYFIKFSVKIVITIKRIIGYPISVVINLFRKIIKSIRKLITNIINKLQKIPIFFAKNKKSVQLSKKYDKIKE